MAIILSLTGVVLTVDLPNSISLNKSLDLPKLGSLLAASAALGEGEAFSRIFFVEHFKLIVLKIKVIYFTRLLSKV